MHTEGRDLVIPYPEGLTKRRWSREKDNPFGLEKEGRAFTWRDQNGGPTGAGQVPFLPPDFEPGQYMVVFEGETDTMAAWQAAPAAMKPRIVGLSGADAWAKMRERGYVERLFADAKRVFVVMDNEDPYQSPEAAASVERGWKALREDLGKRARRVTLPQGINDVAEFFMQYDWAAFQALLKRADTPIRNYPRLDLSKPVPDTEWLVEDLLVAKEVTVLAADSGVGKSMIMGSLAVAIARGDKAWLGKKIARHGKVMVVDEEQSAQLAMQRLAALASSETERFNTLPANVRDNLEYIWYAGVDLVNEADKLLEDALEVEPVLIVIDSQSRVALGVEENDNTEMSALYRRSLVPLARETGAAVVVIHHTASDNAGKPRGATAIKAAADQVISIIAAEAKGGVKTGTLNIFPSKPRRITTHLQARLVGDIEKDGWIRVEAPDEEDPY